ncbi:MAG: glycosyltransferase family 4 protein [Alphaproteobacteria bacterium]|nr:glycosyltransferase family 4 protein [Alphaproteobacteria bacterium]
MVKRVAFAVPGDLATPTGGYAYDRRMIAELQKLGWQVDVIELGDGFPRPSPATKTAAHDALAAVAKDCPIVIDGLAFGVLPEAAKALHDGHLLLALVHHPLALETGLPPADAAAFKVSEYDALAAAHGVVVTSPSTSKLLIDDYDVPPDLVTVACPGTDRGTMAKGSSDGIVRLLAVGSVVPRKGYDVLIQALTPLAGRAWRLTIAGDRTRDEAAAMQLDAEIVGSGLVGQIEVLGALPADRIDALYAASDVFVLPSRFEGYGMAFAEALAYGLPVVGTTAGAIPDTVPPNAGVLIEPNDIKALTRTLRMLIDNPKERLWFAAGAREAGAALPTWQDSAKLLAGAIEALA